MEDETGRKKRSKAWGWENSYYKGIIDAEVQLPVTGPDHHNVHLVIFGALRRLEEELNSRPQSKDCGIITGRCISNCSWTSSELYSPNSSTGSGQRTDLGKRCVHLEKGQLQREVQKPRTVVQVHPV